MKTYTFAVGETPSYVDGNQVVSEGQTHTGITYLKTADGKTWYFHPEFQEWVTSDVWSPPSTSFFGEDGGEYSEVYSASEEFNRLTDEELAALERAGIPEGDVVDVSFRLNPGTLDASMMRTQEFTSEEELIRYLTDIGLVDISFVVVRDRPLDDFSEERDIG